MHLVDHDVAHARERAGLLEPPQHQTRRAVLHGRRRRALRLAAHAVAHEAADGLARLLGDARRQGRRGEAPRLADDDARVMSAARRERLDDQARHLRALAAARRAPQDRHGVRVDRVEDGRAVLEGRQRRPQRVVFCFS